MDDEVRPGDREGDILSAKVDETGDIEHARVVDGEVHHGTYIDVPAEDHPPLPTEVETAPVNELDAAVHQMAMDAQGPPVEPTFEGAPPAPTVVMNERGGYTEEVVGPYGPRQHTVDFESVHRDPPEVREHIVETIVVDWAHGEVISDTTHQSTEVVHDAFQDPSAAHHADGDQSGAHGEVSDSAHAAAHDTSLADHGGE